MSAPRAPDAGVSDTEPYVSVFANQSNETMREKFKRRVGENPLVPLFIALTGVSLIGASYCYRTGRQRYSQYFQRARVSFQTLTVVALVAGTFLGLHDKDKKQQ